MNKETGEYVKRKLLLDIKKYIEEAETQINNMWGMQIEVKEMPLVYDEILKMLDKE